jgi:hypothetical protein
LPANVQRWLDRSFPAGAPLPKEILNTQEGEMDIRGNWMPFTAKTHYQAHPLSFVWEARFKMMPGLWITATDGHDEEGGWGGSKLWGIVPMGGQKGPEVYAMQVVRSLAELPWKPQFALALPDLAWRDSGDASFQVRTVAGSQEISVSFELNSAGDITRASSKRYYDVPDGFVESPWHYDFSEHRQIGTVRIPTSAVATYDKPEGAWEYWRGRIASVVAGP